MRIRMQAAKICGLIAVLAVATPVSAKQASGTGTVYTMSDVVNTDPALVAKFTQSEPKQQPLDSPAYQSYRTGPLTDTITGRMFVRFKNGAFAPCYDEANPELVRVFAMPATAYSVYLLNLYAFQIAQTNTYPGGIGQSVGAPWWISDSGIDRERGSLVRASPCSPSSEYELHVSPGSWLVYAIVEAHRLGAISVGRSIGGQSDDGELQFHVDLPSQRYLLGFSDAFFVIAPTVTFQKPGLTFAEQRPPLVLGHFPNR